MEIHVISDLRRVPEASKTVAEGEQVVRTGENVQVRRLAAGGAAEVALEL